jgi:hypothetical protein
MMALTAWSAKTPICGLLSIALSCDAEILLAPLQMMAGVEKAVKGMTVGESLTVGGSTRYSHYSRYSRYHRHTRCSMCEQSVCTV